jgi:hypothetical protein
VNDPHPDTVRWRRSGAVLWRTAPEYLVLATVEGRTAEVFGPGADIWVRLVEWTAERDLIDDLARRFAAPVETVAPDTRRLLRQLSEQGYVDRRD